MVLQPYISKVFGIPDEVAGAWLGGTLDTSGSVVAAGSLISETAMKVGVIVKMSQKRAHRLCRLYSGSGLDLQASGRRAGRRQTGCG